MSNTVRYFQWVIGEKKGEICLFDHIESDGENIYIAFTDKSRINEKFVAQINQHDLTGKMMAEIDHPNNCWTFKEEIIGGESTRVEQDANSGLKYDIPSVDEMVHAELSGQTGIAKPTPKKKKITLIPPKRTPPTHSVFGKIKNDFSSITPPPPPPPPPSARIIKEGGQVEEQPQTNNNIADPVWILYSKSRKTSRNIDVTISVSIPDENLYNIAKDSFENGDKLFISYILSEINNNGVIDAIKTALIDLYEKKETTMKK